MPHYTNEQLASALALPIVSVLLLWTCAIFQRNRRAWAAYDVPLVTLLVLSTCRNLAALLYTLLVVFLPPPPPEYCSIAVWIFNSIHTFQASCLTTLSVIALFSVRLQLKRRHLRHFLTPTHVIYHLFCLTTLCACVGVAAILARDDDGAKFENFGVFDTNPCKFMPFDLDLKYNVFVIVLNVFLASVTFVAFVATCVNHVKIKKQGFDYLKKSNSDLSDLSLGLGNENKNYYDTYTIQRGHVEPNYYEGQNNNVGWNSDVSNISTTVSSTNSRRPCINQKPMRNEDENRSGLETIHPVLIVCYLFYHLPLIILSIYPDLISPWPIAGVALWLGLIQDILIPIGLSIVDSRFCRWVSNIYRCSNKHGDKLPHVGLDGKFRPFSSPPQSLEVTQHHRPLQTMEHRFPITNGSLYTSIDGRLPVIHNYRRHKDSRVPVETRRHDHFDHVIRPPVPPTFACRACEADLCPSHSNLHHLSTPHHSNKHINFEGNPPSQECQQHDNNNSVMKNSRNLVRLNRMRLCKSENSLHPEGFKVRNKELNEQILDYSSSEEEDVNVETRNFDSLSSRSSYSITTEANCDFEFFQTKDNKSTNDDVRPKIQRSSSYMTLEDRNRKRGKKLLRSNSKLSDCTHNIRQKVKSVEYLPNSNASTVFIEDVFYFNYPNQRSGEVNSYVGSVPDLKKVFISEYI